MQKFIFSIITFFLAACTGQRDNMLLDYNDVQFFKVREIKSVPLVSLEISGLAFHSSLAVESIETKTEADCMVILVHLVPTRTGLVGNFTYYLDIPKEINAVCFGTTKHIVWKRCVGAIN